MTVDRRKKRKKKGKTKKKKAWDAQVAWTKAFKYY